MHSRLIFGFAAFTAIGFSGNTFQDCLKTLMTGIPREAANRSDRFLGKIDGRFQTHPKLAEAAAFCAGGQQAVEGMKLPWIDWRNYYGTGDATSRPKPENALAVGPFAPDKRGVTGALLDLELERIELLKFNLFDNSGTYEEYIKGRNGTGGPAIKYWDAMRLPPGHPLYQAVGGDQPVQMCTGDLIRKRTLTGICNDIRNPLMGSSGQLFGRNVQFETTFPELGVSPETRNRHGDRLGLLKPDPQVISRRLFTRDNTKNDSCRDGHGAADPSQSDCGYQPAPFMNVLAAFWIQFMTHDWFSHLEEGHNASEFMSVGCSPADAERYGCRPGDRIDRGFVAESTPPGTFDSNGMKYLQRAPKTMRNTNTAWWDASQIYGFDEVSVKRVKRDPADPAKLLLAPNGSRELFLPLLATTDPMNPEWKGQEATAFADNWTIGMSFYTNVFAREHNAFVDAFRKLDPKLDSGLRNPSQPKHVIHVGEVSPDELYDVARLVVSAEIAKIHTIEWTPQLLYDEPLYIGMNANWSGLLGDSNPGLTKILHDIISQGFGKSTDPRDATKWYSIFASGAGIIGTGSHDKHWNQPTTGYNHFGSPFNFPEEFVSVYRLHPLIPDLMEYRKLDGDPNAIVERIPVVDTFRGKATEVMHTRGLANWALTMGRQRLGLLTLNNHPAFLQNLTMQRLESDTKQIDVAALDLIRDRERGVPRFNEFRRQYGLHSLRSFDDFLDPGNPATPARVAAMREIYGQHICDESKEITTAQRNVFGTGGTKYVNDCLGFKNGTLIDNIEDVDLQVGYLAEPLTMRPHGYAISETQFVVFILNASRRLFSDRFLTASYRPEFYTTFGLNWVNHNGPAQLPKVDSNGHSQDVSPLKQVLLRAMPELAKELDPVVNAFDPWARQRGVYYDLTWQARPGAEGDPAFPKKNP